MGVPSKGQTVTVTPIKSFLYHATNLTLTPNKILNCSRGKRLELEGRGLVILSKSCQNVGSSANPRVRGYNRSQGRAKSASRLPGSLMRSVRPANWGSVSLGEGLLSI